MEDQKLKKRPSTENKGHVAPKRLHREVKRDLNSTESPLPSSSTSLASSKVLSGDSPSPLKSSDDDDQWSYLDPETKALYFMPVDPGGDSHIDKLDEYSKRGKLDIKCIDIDFTHTIEHTEEHDDEISEILNRTLLAAVDSLEEIVLRNPVGYLPDLVFPLMKKVVKLQLLFYWWGSDSTNVTKYLRSGEIFPKGFTFSVMPKLEEVVINLNTEGKSPMYYSTFDCWKNNLKYCGIAGSVKKIKYSDNCGFLTTRLKTTFPKAVWPDHFKEVLEYPPSDSSSEDSFDSSTDSSTIFIK